MSTTVQTTKTLRRVCTLCQLTCRRMKSTNVCPFRNSAMAGDLSGATATVTLTDQNILSENDVQKQTGIKSKPSVPGPVSLPLIGTLYKYIPYVGEYSVTNQMQTDRRRYKKYGSLVREEMFPGFTIYHVYDPELIRQVYHQERTCPERFPMPGLKAYREDRKAGNGIALSSGNEWKRIRASSADLMRQPYLASFVGNQLDISDKLVQLIGTSRNDKDELEDSLPIFYRYALESVCNMLFGKRFGILEPELDEKSDAMGLIDAVLTAMESLYLTTFFWPLHKNKRTKAWKKLCESSDFIRSVGEKHAEQCLQELQTQQDGGTNSYLKTLLSKPDLDKHDCLNIVADVLFAGMETTGMVLAFNMYNLARFPDKQDKLLEEVEKYAPSGKPLDTGCLQKMSYLKAVMKETFRYTPLGVGNARITTQETNLGGYDIPKGSLMLLNSLIPSELPEYVSEPSKFIPERWLGSHGDKLHPYLVLPFGLGGRSCIGRRLAMLEMQVAIIKLIRKFKVEYHHEEVKFVTRFANTPDRPLQLRFIKR